MSNGRRLAFAGTLVMLASTDAFAAHPNAQILHHEPIAIVSSSNDSTARKSATAEHISFEAFGKHFDLTLQPNERVRRALKAGTGNFVPLRGTIDGLSHSWARLTRNDDGRWQGMISDGQEIYAIEPAGDVKSMLVEPNEQSGSTPVMYRLKDLIVEWEPGFCEALPAGETTTAFETFKALGAEVIQAEAQSGVVTQQASVGVVGDWEYVSYFSGSVQTPTQGAIARMNVVDGIFSDQVGVTIDVPTIQMAANSNDAFSSSDSKQLLDQVRTYRKGNSAQKVLALTHLMTGRALDGKTVGIAYTGTVCDGEYAVSLSEGTQSMTMASLIAAHEIGHNFNAPHDGDSNGACASTPTTFLMAPQINYSDQFSACSLQQIQKKIATARCLTTYSPPDVAVEIAAPTVQGTVGNSLSASLSVRSTGASPAQNVSVTAAVPNGLTLNSTTASNGATCTTGAGTVSCIFGDVEAGGLRTVTLNVTSQSAATYPIDISAASSNDGNSTNNAGRIDVSITAQSTAPDPSPSAASSGGGGGGSMSLWMLLGLAGVLVKRRLMPMNTSFRGRRHDASDVLSQ
jgi:uncharacterized repeat protein (TIGR01451 family)